MMILCYYPSVETTESQVLFQKGLQAGMERDYHQAKNIFLRLTQRDFPKAPLYLARSYHGLGEFDKAIILFQAILREKEDPLVLFLMGRSLLQSGQEQRATSVLERALRLGYQEDPIWGLLGMCYIKTKRPEAACEVLKKGVQAFPESQPLYQGYLNALFVSGLKKFHQQDFTLARQMLQFVKDNGIKSTALNLHLGNCYKEEGFFEEAMKNYEEALQEHPEDAVLQRIVWGLRKILENPRADNSRSDTSDETLPGEFFKQKDYAKALHYAHRIIQQGRGSWEIHFIAAEAYRRLKIWSKAVLHYQRARTMNPHSREVCLGLLWVFWELKRYQEVVKEASTLLQKEPENVTALYYKTLGTYRIQPHGSPQLHRDLQELLALRPLDLELLLANAKILRSWELTLKVLKKEPDREEAFLFAFALDPSFKNSGWVGLCEKYLKKQPHHLLALKILIRILISSKNYPKAKRFLLKLASLAPMKTFYTRALALCYRKLELYHDALVLYKQLLEEDEENLELITHALFCLQKSGQHDLAIHFLTSVMAKHPDASDLTLRLAVQEYRNQNWQTSLIYFQKTLEKHPRDKKLLTVIAKIYDRLGDPLMANRYLDHAKKF